VAWLTTGLGDVEFARTASGRGVEVVALSEYALNWKGRNGLQIGFASVGPTELRRGVRAIANLL
jgi:DNA-binding transcriptional MocR family regulator